MACYWLIHNSSSNQDQRMKQLILVAALLVAATTGTFAQGGISRKSSASPQNSPNAGSNATSVGVMKNQQAGTNNKDKMGGTPSEQSSSGQYRRGQTVDASSQNKKTMGTGANSANAKNKSGRRSQTGANSTNNQ